jgi:hypothetical protein
MASGTTMSVPARYGGIGRLVGRGPTRSEQSVNNLLPNTKEREALSGNTGRGVNNQRTTFSRIPGTKRVPVRATDTKNPRGQTPASIC